MSRNSLKWLPAFVVPTVVVAAVIAVPLQAGAAVDLPDKTPEQILLMVNDSTVSTLSGAITQSAELGLPDLSALSGMTSTMPQSTPGQDPSGAESETFMSALELLSGSRDFRIYLNGDSQSRIQIQDRMDERNIVRNGDDLWLYDSTSNQATHLTIPAEVKSAAEANATAFAEKFPTTLSTPADVAKSLLSELDASTTVTVGKDVRVAGRSAYQLVLTPKSVSTLVASVTVSVDSETGVPLDVTVMASGQTTPALSIGFTSVNFAAPDSDLFTFVPPANATVVEKNLPDLPALSDTDSAIKDQIDASERPVITGTGWSSILSVPASNVPTELRQSPMLEQVTVAVDGGRSATSSLLTVFFADDGRVLMGAVPLEALQAAAR